MECCGKSRKNHNKNEIKCKHIYQYKAGYTRGYDTLFPSHDTICTQIFAKTDKND